jgi:hypothetical protein
VAISTGQASVSSPSIEQSREQRAEQRAESACRPPFVVHVVRADP